MIIDVSFYPTFYNAEKSKTYKDLIETMIQVDQTLYEKLNIYVETHSVIPKFESMGRKGIEILLPVSIHFMAHYLRAKESTTYFEKAGNYTIAYNIFNNSKNKEVKSIKGFFEKQLKECEEFVIKWFKAPSFEQIYGEEKAALIKSKISETMKNLQKEIIEKRTASIQKYAKNRPLSHNQAIAKGKIKKITEYSTGKIYDNINEASFFTGISQSSIRRSCQGKIDKVKGMTFRYLRKDLYDLM